MGIVELLLVSVGLAMDAFAVSVCKGLGMRRINATVALVLAFLFGLFQGGMPVIGWLLGSQLMWLIEPIDHWIAFGLLAFIGGKMIVDAVREENEDAGATDHVAWGEFLMLAVATSIDALAVGISLAALNVNIVQSALVIGVVTFVISLVGVGAGHLFGSRYERHAQVVGGVVLILIGLKVLLEHLGLAFWA
ncbi:MAG: manganese efflux pump MntP family protein [Coriobacteriales bacterium]|nr:manganese efflux pump MntP family protein [Coriobacteriales bacterium]